MNAVAWVRLTAASVRLLGELNNYAKVYTNSFIERKNVKRKKRVNGTVQKLLGARQDIHLSVIRFLDPYY